MKLHGPAQISGWVGDKSNEFFGRVPFRRGAKLDLSPMQKSLLPTVFVNACRCGGVAFIQIFLVW